MKLSKKQRLALIKIKAGFNNYKTLSESLGVVYSTADSAAKILERKGAITINYSIYPRIYSLTNEGMEEV